MNISTSSGGSQGAPLPAIINIEDNGQYRRLVFGQAAATEQIHPAFVKDVVRIDLEGSSGNWGSPSVKPSPDESIKKGDLIRLIMPAGQGDAKIYYTLDGTVPTRNSTMYNTVADRWLGQKGMSENSPIVAPSDKFVLRARIIGIGKGDGPVVNFIFNSSSLTIDEDENEILGTTIDDLLEGSVSITQGGSFFVPAEKNSIKWNKDELDGSYDDSLKGYTFTAKEGFTGISELIYIDKDGNNHFLSVTVLAGEEEILALIDDVQSPTSDFNDLGSTGGIGNNTVVGSTKKGLSQGVFITLCVVASVGGSVIGMTMPNIIRKLRKKKTTAVS